MLGARYALRRRPRAPRTAADGANAGVNDIVAGMKDGSVCLRDVFRTRLANCLAATSVPASAVVSTMDSEEGAQKAK